MPVEANVLDDAISLAAVRTGIERLDPEKRHDGVSCSRFPNFPLFNRTSATKPVVIGFLAFSNRYIGFGCSGLKQVTCAHFIGFVAV